MATEAEVRAAMLRLRFAGLIQPRAWRDEDVKLAAWREYLAALLPVPTAALNAAVTRIIAGSRHFPLVSEIIAAVPGAAMSDDPWPRSAHLQWTSLLRDYRPGGKWPWSSIWGCCRPEHGKPEGCPQAVYEAWRARTMRPALRVIDGGAA